MNFIAVSAAAFLAASLAAGAFAADDAQKASRPFELAARNRKLVSKYSDSMAVVRYYVKKNEKGVEPSFEIPYKCPNCNSTHYRDGVVSSEKKIPAEFAGFVISPDCVLMSDIMLPPEFVERIEVECAGEVVVAEEFEVSCENKALFLKTAKPLSKAKPIKFVRDRNPESPSYFFMVREEGVTVAGVAESKIAAFRHLVELGRDVYEGNPNTLVVNKALEPVTVALQDRIELGKEVFSSPFEWPREPAAKRFERIAALEAKLAKSVIPVNIQLEAESKDSGGRFSMRWRSHGDMAGKNDIDTAGLVVEGGKVLVVAGLSAQDTARLVKIEATAPDGQKVPLRFEGSYQAEGAFAASIPAEKAALFEPLRPDPRNAVELWSRRFYSVMFRNLGGKMEFITGLARVGEFRRISGNVPAAVFARESGLEDFARSSRDDVARCYFALDGSLVAVGLKKRNSDHWSDIQDVQGGALVAMVDSPKYDPENVPRKLADRQRVPYFGVEVQAAGLEIAREKKALVYLKENPESAALVTEVYPGSPAAKLGVKAGDILVSMRHADGGRDSVFSVERDFDSEIDWSEAFDDARFVEVASIGIITPWHSIEDGIKNVVRSFSVGAKVAVSWVSDGQLKAGTATLALAPVQYANAPRARNKDLSITVCDMTGEVRRYFKFDGKSPGVVIAKVKSGGVGAVAGLRPLELIIEVNGEGVVSAKDFQEKTKGKKELNFTVRRLSSTRVVPIRL